MSVVSSVLQSQTAYGRCFLSPFLLAVALLLVTGCSQVSHGDRVPLVGTVTLEGKPLDVNATIYFEPLSGQGGVGSSGEISAGRFSIPAESGPTPGQTYKVIVITAPGIPPDGTPRDQMKLPQTLETTITLPAREDENPELQIAL